MICDSRSDTHPFLFEISQGGFLGWHSQVFDHDDGGGSGGDEGVVLVWWCGSVVMVTLIYNLIKRQRHFSLQL